MTIDRHNKADQAQCAGQLELAECFSVSAT